MKHSMDNSNPFKDYLHKLFISYIPNRRDNLKQIIIKVFFLISLITLLTSAGYLTNYFLSNKKQDNIIAKSRDIWHSSSIAESDDKSQPENPLILENSDFKGWITISNTRVDNPIYQTTDNSFYLNHNQKKQYSAYGALFFDHNNDVSENSTDKNLVIYGHQMKNGTMFGSLHKLRSLSFYKQNPIIDFSTLYKSNKYVIYSIFVLNASKADDDNYIYNITRKIFSGEEDFNNWTAEAYERSLINTGVKTQYGDNIITLVTCCSDFDNARLVIMARELKEGESSQSITSSASLNPKPKYPRRWYKDRKIDYPFN